MRKHGLRCSAKDIQTYQKDEVQRGPQDGSRPSRDCLGLVNPTIAEEEEGPEKHPQQSPSR